MKKKRAFLLATLATYVLSLPGYAEHVDSENSGYDTPSFERHRSAADIAGFAMSTKEMGNVKEFYSSNKDNRFLIHVHIWGDTPLSGMHYIPDNSTLLDALSYSGGPTGQLQSSTITINRPSRTGAKDTEVINIDAKSLVSKQEYVNFPLRNGDVIYIESPPKVDNVARNLGIMTAVLGIITAGTTLYLLTRH